MKHVHTRAEVHVFPGAGIANICLSLKEQILIHRTAWYDNLFSFKKERGEHRCGGQGNSRGWGPQHPEK